ncbi:MAG: cobalamin biosynthesis protein CbiX [Roseibacillus sp.]|nr:cobalamin biosynthesis protein CbiX [Roseibacillus sp.]
MSDPPCILLVDNGSFRAESTLSLRRTAEALGVRICAEVHPVSLLHSIRVDPVELGGVPAQVFEPFLRARQEEGRHSFLVVPLFFGPSAAIYEYLPQRVRDMSGSWPELEVRVAPSMVELDEPDDTRVARILGDLVVRKMKEEDLEKPAVILVDHGTPREAVNRVRNHVTAQLHAILDDRVATVEASSMERREEAEYDFNEPLLENLLGRTGFDREVVLAMLFISPGRHAGAGGDIARLCESAEARCPGLRIHGSDLFVTHPGAIDLLVRRYEEGLAGKPVQGEIAAPGTE